MNFRSAAKDDLPQLKTMYKEIISNMNKNNIEIWDDVYPCEFFSEDIENNCLYVLEENKEIISAFALCDSSLGENYVEWKSKLDRALYIDRFGVNIRYLKRGIGRVMLDKAIALTKERGVKYLRLFVVDINEPAINLYIKSGFEKVNGFYDERVDDNIILHEFGFEIDTSV